MKKKLEADLISIAHNILKLKGKEDVLKMHAEITALYEKISVLKFAHENFEDDFPTIGSDTSFFKNMQNLFNNPPSDSIESNNKIYVDVDDVKDEAIIEPVMEKIKDMVAQMPPETQQVDDLVNQVISKETPIKNDFEEITADFKDIPEFEPIDPKETKKKTLNDTIKSGGLTIGLNDKIAFVKHLFDGNNEDYERVLSQINTTTSLQEAQNLINNLVKPDYSNWKGKEDYQERFMALIESKFA